MSWIKIDDGMTEHPKLVHLSDPAFRVWHRALGYCSRHSTDGLITHAMLRSLGARPKLIAELTTVVPPYEHALLEVVDTGYQMHDYLDYQPSRESVLAKRKWEAERKKSQRDKARDDQPDGAHTRPRSPELTKTDTTHSPPTAGAGGSEQVSPHGDKPVDHIGKVVQHLSKLANRDVHPSEAAMVSEWVLDRAKGHITYPTRYVLRSITRDWAQWQQFLETGVLPE